MPRVLGITRSFLRLGVSSPLQDPTLCPARLLMLPGFLFQAEFERVGCAFSYLQNLQNTLYRKKPRASRQIRKITSAIVKLIEPYSTKTENSFQG